MIFFNEPAKRDAWVVSGVIVIITLLCWVYLVRMAQCMCHMAARIPEWDSAYFSMMLTMWVVMMVGMMLPSAAPMVLIYAGIARKARQEGRPISSTAAFALGYLLAWTLFSVAATLAQWQLDRLALLSPMMVSTSPYFGAAILVAAGIYQLSPAKDQCLVHCRTPAHFIAGHWKPGIVGALRMGLEHGLFCIGCCWAIMLLLFVGGVMNLLWIAAITVFVLLEKVLPMGERLGRWAGIALVIGGIVFVTLNLWG